MSAEELRYILLEMGLPEGQPWVKHIFLPECGLDGSNLAWLREACPWLPGMVALQLPCSHWVHRLCAYERARKQQKEWSTCPTCSTCNEAVSPA